MATQMLGCRCRPSCPDWSVAVPRWGTRRRFDEGMALVEVTLADGSTVQVSYPRVPPAPRIRADRREELARQWLVSLSQAPTPERVQALAPLVGQFASQSPLGRIASQFVSSNRVPVMEDVIAVYLRRRAARPAVPPAAVPSDTTERLLGLIDAHWASHGQGPSWSHLGREVGLDRHAVMRVLRELRSTGAVTFTSTPGSLRRDESGASSPSLQASAGVE